MEAIAVQPHACADTQLPSDFRRLLSMTMHADSSTPSTTLDLARAGVSPRACARVASLLDRYGFDAARFAQQQEWIRQGTPLDRINQLNATLSPVPDDSLLTLPPVDSAEHRALHEHGSAALGRGEVGVVILAGGMATRFGGEVKALVPVTRGLTFLECKLRQIEQAARDVIHPSRPIPVYLMTSFATHEAITRFISAYHSPLLRMHTLPQHVAIRLDERGEPLVGDDGQLDPTQSLYAPGHGDLVDVFRESGLLEEFVAGGGACVYVSNVDNLGASLDPVWIGLHQRTGKGVTVEVAPKLSDDQGGGPLIVDGTPQIVEAFRLPPEFDPRTLTVFNTNSMFIDAQSLRAPQPLQWFVAQKHVEGRRVYQFERLIGQLTAFVPCAFVRVPRNGPRNRFIPIKTPRDLHDRMADIELVLAHQHVL
jgi:UTP--glucose-1-phosphate uridylyltransferase